MSDPVRSIIQTQHPQLAGEVRDAISVMEKVLALAGNEIVLPSQIPSANVRSIRASESVGESAVQATIDTQTASDTGKPGSTPIVQLAAGDAFGRYQVVSLLGAGAMGSVYLAYDPALERHVAIKIPVLQNSIALERFYIEARATATLRNPNICPVYDVGQINGVHFISMAYIEGKPLSKVIHGEPMGVAEVTTILSKIARGIQKAHERGVIHRDIKPDNIMIDVDSEPVVMDFGLAIRQDEDIRLTKEGSLIGSPAYMAPEQAEGKQSLIGTATDIYGLGVVLYEMLTQKLPFDGPLTKILNQITSEPPPPPSVHIATLAGTPIEKVCLRMLEKSPSDRIACMGDVADLADECGLREVGIQGPGRRRKRFSIWPFSRVGL